MFCTGGKSVAIFYIYANSCNIIFGKNVKRPVICLFEEILRVVVTRISKQFPSFIFLSLRSNSNLQLSRLQEIH